MVLVSSAKGYRIEAQENEVSGQKLGPKQLHMKRESQRDKVYMDIRRAEAIKSLFPVPA